MKSLRPFFQNPSRLFDRSAWNEELARLAFAIFLVSIALLGLVETLIAPGRLIRRPLGFTSVDPLAVTVPAMNSSDDTALHPTVAAIDGLLGTDKQREQARNASRQQTRSLIESRYQLSRQPFDTATTEHGLAWDRFVSEGKRVLSVDLSAHPYDTRQTPARLNRLVLDDESVKSAWAGLRQLAAEGHQLKADTAAHALVRPDHLGTEDDLVGYRQRCESLVARISKHRVELADAVRVELEHLRIALEADRRLNP